MAQDTTSENQIDDLVLDIDVKGLTDKKVNTINAFASAIEELNKQVANVENLERYLKSLAELSESIKTIVSGTATSKTTGQGQTHSKLKTINVDDPTQKKPEELTPIQKRINESVGIMATESEKAKDVAEFFGKTMYTLDDSFKKVSEKVITLKDETQQTISVFKGLNEAGQEVTITFKNGLEVSRTTKDLKKNEEQTKKSTSSFKKLFESIKRIAIYRMIRTAIKEITQAMREGINNYVQYSEETNKAMSNLKNSLEQVKNTFGVTLGYLVQTLEPIITSLLDSVVKIIDSLNMALAKSIGKETFDKAKKSADDYAESLKKTNSQLASFDKFNVIGGAEENKPEYETADIAENWDDTADIFETIIQLVQELWDILKEVVDVVKEILTDKDLKATIPIVTKAVIEMVKALKPLVKTLAPIIAKLVTALTPVLTELSLVITEIVVELLDGLSPILYKVIDIVEFLLQVILKFVQFIRPVFTMIAGALKALGGIFEWLGGVVALVTGKMKENWKSVTDFFVNGWQKVANGFAKIINSIANLFIGWVNWMIDIINELIKPISDISEFFGGKKLEVGHWNAVANWQPYPETYANGGVPAVGTMFIAGEAGAEAVYNMSNGRTGVANVEQLQAAFAGALDQRTNVYLDAIYKNMDNQYENNNSRTFTMNEFINTIMPEIDKYNQRRGRF